mgnify:FL=1
MSNRSVCEYIPRILREPLSNPEVVVQTVLSAELANGTMTVDQAVGFLEGFMEHQDAITRKKHADSDETKSKVFPVIIKSVKKVERRSGNFTLGTKYEIKYSPERDEDKTESIFTGWFEFNGSTDVTWETALSRSILEDIENCDSKRMFLRKAFARVEGLEKGDEVRYVANVMPKLDYGNTSQNSKVTKKLINAVRDEDVDLITDEIEDILGIKLNDRQLDTIEDILDNSGNGQSSAVKILKEFQ